MLSIEDYLWRSLTILIPVGFPRHDSSLDWYSNADQQSLMYIAEKQQTLPMPEQMQNAMMNADMGSADENFDLRFINAMLPHHQGAVARVGEALLKNDRLEIRRLSGSILSQQQEIF